MTTPCGNCPFRREGGIRLDSASRVREIADTDGVFPCHKGVDYDGDSDGEPIIPAKAPVCAGWLLFNEKRGHAGQLVRIAERLRSYDASKMQATNPASAEVFDTVKEMVAAQRQAKVRS